MKILVFAASAQRNSVNKKLAAAIAARLQSLGKGEVYVPDFKDFTMPMYDGDIEQATSVPEAAQALAAHFRAADAVVICTPEYNGSILGSLKNAMDWMSRLNPQPLRAKPVLMTGASPGALGAIRGLWHSRVPFEALGAFVYPDMFGLAAAHEAFDADGQLVDVPKAEQLGGLLDKFIQFATAFAIR